MSIRLIAISDIISGLAVQKKSDEAFNTTFGSPFGSQFEVLWCCDTDDMFVMFENIDHNKRTTESVCVNDTVKF